MKFTDQELKDMSLEKAITEIINEVYAATSLFERLEGKGKIIGNGHRIRQKVSKFAEALMRSRWRLISFEVNTTVKTQRLRVVKSPPEHLHLNGLTINSEQNWPLWDDDDAWNDINKICGLKQREGEIGWTAKKLIHELYCDNYLVRVD